jgi:hypothetical protein
VSHAKEVSLETLRRIVVEGNAIHAQIGNSPQKVARILAQAEAWFEKYQCLLNRLNNISNPSNIYAKTVAPIGLSELTDAISDSEAMLSFDLEEVLSLKRVVDRIHQWFNRVATVAPLKRSKRVGKSRWSSKATRCTLDELNLLLHDAKTLPIYTDDEEQRIQLQISEIQQWQKVAQQKIQTMASVIQSIGGRMAQQKGASLPSIWNDGYSSFSIEDKSCFKCIQVHNSHGKNHLPHGYKHSSLHEESQSSEVETPFDLSLLCSMEPDDYNILINADTCITMLIEEAQKLGVMTFEEEVLVNLEKVVKWFISSVHILASPIKLYENNASPKLTELLQSGDDIRKCCSNELLTLDLHSSFGQIVQSSWSEIIKHQLKLLENLNIQRDTFLNWSSNVELLLSVKEKKLTFDTIDELVTQSQQYPSCKFSFLSMPYQLHQCLTNVST